MAEMNYLTVQDMLWINLRVTGKPSDWHFMKLEEGTYYQYAYGASTNVVSQAARFASGFAKNAPFSAGNAGTAFVGVLTFLRINGRDVNLDDASALGWFQRVTSASGGESAVEEISAEAGEHGHDADEGAIKEIAESLIQSFPQTLAALSGK